MIFQKSNRLKFIPVIKFKLLIAAVASIALHFLIQIITNKTNRIAALNYCQLYIIYIDFVYIRCIFKTFDSGEILNYIITMYDYLLVNNRLRSSLCLHIV